MIPVVTLLIEMVFRKKTEKSTTQVFTNPSSHRSDLRSSPLVTWTALAQTLTLEGLKGNGRILGPDGITVVNVGLKAHSHR